MIALHEHREVKVYHAEAVYVLPGPVPLIVTPNGGLQSHGKIICRFSGYPFFFFTCHKICENGVKCVTFYLHQLRLGILKSF